MSGSAPRNIAHSVHQRLLNQARESGRPFNEILQYYAMERFLYRLAKSRYAQQFILKGALMFVVWKAPRSRPTMDIDLLGRASNSPNDAAALFKDVCNQEVEPDGLTFDAKTVKAEATTEDADYAGVRVRIRGRLGNARVSLQIDIGFADVLIPGPTDIDYPTILDLPAPHLRGYSRESTVAEKFEAMTKLGILNSRMKDFYDIWLLATHFDFDGKTLAKAISETFSNRGTDLQSRPVGLTAVFGNDRTKQTQWKAFLRKLRIEGAPAELADTILTISGFLCPVVETLLRGKVFGGTWHAPGPWSLPKK